MKSEIIPASPACFILEISALIAVATTAKSLNIDPPNIAIPAKMGIFAIPFLSPKNANDNPIRIAMATPGILFLNIFLEIQKEISITMPTNRKANTSPFLEIIFSMISIPMFLEFHCFCQF